MILPYTELSENDIITAPCLVLVYAVWKRKKIMPLDTSAEAARIQSEIHRSLGAPRRLQIACQLSQTARDLARARIRSKHPEFDDSATRDWLIWELYGLKRNRR